MVKCFFLCVSMCLCIHAISQTDISKNSKQIIDTATGDIYEPAEFHGGTKGWIEYLQNNLNKDLTKHIVIPKKKKNAQVTVIVSFVIATNGAVSKVHAQSTIPEKVHPDFIAEAIRVIEKGPNWITAKKNGKPVIFTQLQPITWQVTSE